jgi:hypothetical protein
MALLLEPRFCKLARCARQHHAKGLCLMHYRRQRRTGDATAPHRGHSPEPDMSRHGPCAAPGCLESILAKGRCQKHYIRQRARAAA